MASFRHLARILVMQTIFAHEFRGGDPQVLLEYNYRQYFQGKKADVPFSEMLLSEVLSHKEEIQKIIEKNAPEWPFDKIAPIDRAILEIGVYEICYSKDVPPLVAVNEAVEIGKEYGGENSAKFVNAVLSAVMEEHQKNNQNP